MLGDKGCQEVECVLTPGKGRGKPRVAEEANRAHTRLRGCGEPAVAQLKKWKDLVRLHCCPCRAGQLDRAIQVLHDRES